MLCDDLVAEGNLGNKHFLSSVPVIGSAKLAHIGKIAERVVSAQKFVLTDNLTCAIDQIARWRPSSLSSATEYARLPFPLTWLEWSDPVRKVESLEMEWNDVPVSRTGMLLQQDASPASGEAWLVWKSRVSYLGPKINVSVLKLVFDFNRGSALTEAQDPSKFKASEVSEMCRFALKDANEREAFMELTRQASLHFDEMFSHEQSQILDRHNPASDWCGELQFLKAALIMLNSRNGVIAEQSQLDSLNYSRVRRHKAPLFEHNVLKLRLSAPLRRLRPGHANQETIRAHLVRGHYKVRKTGVFWWSSFARGNAKAGIINKRYEVHD